MEQFLRNVITQRISRILQTLAIKPKKKLPTKGMLYAVAEAYCDVETIPQFTCDFWIYNFQIDFDLTKRLSLGERRDTITSPEPAELQQKENGGRRGLHINDFPTEMLSLIFSYCRATDLLAVQAVCARWYDIVHKDKGLWNHVVFSARDLDVKTTANLLWEMPLLRCVDLCNVHSAEDMTGLITVLCNACWQLTQVHFPENCEWHPRIQDLYLLRYYHPKISSLRLCTKQKLIPEEISGLGIELSQFGALQHLTLVGFYWHQAELVSEVLTNVEQLVTLSLPSVPGLTGRDLNKLCQVQPKLKALTVNTSSISGRNLNFKKFLFIKDLKIIDNSTITSEKIKALSNVIFIKSLNLDLSNCCKEEMLNFFGIPRNNLKEIIISNCGFSDELLDKIVKTCLNLLSICWRNPKDSAGEMSDLGLSAITQLPFIRSLDIKSRSVSKTHYATLANMKSLKYVRINGMKIPGCL